MNAMDQTFRRASTRKFVNTRAARFVVLPPANTALNSMAPKSQSWRTQTRLPSSNSRRNEPLDLITIPTPETAAAIAPSFPAIRTRPSTRTDVVVSPFRNGQFAVVLTGPMMIEWAERSAGVRGRPAFFS
jgi:hypothetical protein